jgi:hypothetical protein
MKLNDLLKMIFNPWVMLGSLAVAVILASMTLLLLLATRSDSPPGEPLPAVMNIIPAPTETPTLLPPTPTVASPQETPQPGLFVGGMVQISGTSGEGLRLRYSPGLDSQVRLLGSEGEVFQVMDGPQQADNYTWWYLENPQDRTRRGWGVEDFLSPANAP